MLLTNEEIVKILKYAKNSYVRGIFAPSGICWHIKRALCNHGFNVVFNKDIPCLIPMFNPKFFGFNFVATYDYHWWILSNKEDRIKAFDKLISHYETNK